MKRTISIEIPIKTVETTVIELDLPYFGKVPNEEKYLFIDSEENATVITFWPTINHFAVNSYTANRWKDAIRISDFVPITFREWDRCIMARIRHLEELAYNIEDESRHVISDEMKTDLNL